MNFRTVRVISPIVIELECKICWYRGLGCDPFGFRFYGTLWRHLIVFSTLFCLNTNVHDSFWVQAIIDSELMTLALLHKINERQASRSGAAGFENGKQCTLTQFIKVKPPSYDIKPNSIIIGR